MFEKASMKDGGIEQRNFDSYTPMRMSQIPEIDVSIISNGEPAVGGGHGDCAGDRQRRLQRGRRARALAADHGGSRQGGDEDISGRAQRLAPNRQGAAPKGVPLLAFALSRRGAGYPPPSRSIKFAE